MKTDLDIWLKEHADDCLATIGVGSGQKVLDFGCAIGSYSIPAARIVGKQGKVYAMDKTPEALTTLRRLASAKGLTHIDTINTHGEVQVPLENESVDVVLLHDVLHLIGWEESRGQTTRRSTATDRRALLKEVHRVVKWGGLVSVYSPHLVTHTDITSEDDVKRELEGVGFHLEKELYRKLIHDGRLAQGHLYVFRKRHTCKPAEGSFVYDSPSFQSQLTQDAHHHGEVIILETIAEPGMVALELGANKGVTAIALAKRVGPEGRVYAFEPVPEYFEALTVNLRLNSIENVLVHQLAVTDTESEVRYYKHGEGSGIVRECGSDEILVGTTSVDNFVADQAIDLVDLINMDCEGAELFALRGAEETLRRDAPRIFCEIHHHYLSSLGQSVRDIVHLLCGFGFQVMPVSVENLDKKVDFGCCTHIYAERNGNLLRVKGIGRWQR